MLVDVTSIVSLNHGKLTLADLICKAIESSCYVWMHLQVDPPGNILIFVDLAKNELLPEVLMVDHILRLTTYVLEVAIYSFNNGLAIKELLIEL